MRQQLHGALAFTAGVRSPLYLSFECAVARFIESGGLPLVEGPCLEEEFVLKGIKPPKATRGVMEHSVHPSARDVCRGASSPACILFSS